MNPARLPRTFLPFIPFRLVRAYPILARHRLPTVTATVTGNKSRVFRSEPPDIRGRDGESEGGKGCRKLRKYPPGMDDQEVLDDGEDTLLPRRQSPLRLGQRAGAGAHDRAARHDRLPHPRGLGRTDRARL